MNLSGKNTFDEKKAKYVYEEMDGIIFVVFYLGLEHIRSYVDA